MKLSNVHSIVVTGVGALSAASGNANEFAEHALSGKSEIALHDDVYPGQSVWAGKAVGSALDLRLPFAQSPLPVDRTAHLAAVAVEDAIADAGLDLSRLDPERIGLFLGTSHGGRSQLDQFVANGAEINQNNAHSVLGVGAHAYQTAWLAHWYGVMGPVMTFSTACSSGGLAIVAAMETLLAGDIDLAIAGGADAFSKLTHAGFRALGAAADGPCVPFSERVGMTLGEGAGILVLERKQDGQRRRARLRTELLGYGCSWDAHHLTAPEPNGNGMQRSMAMAVAAAPSLQPVDIDYINAHATGTKANDIAETLAIKNLFGERPPPVSATKSITGHTLGASPVLGLVATIAASEQGRLPPTANFSHPRSGCDLDYVPAKSRQQAIKYFLANSTAFGGVNCSLVGKRPDWEEPSKPIPEVRPTIPPAIGISGIGVISPLGLSVAESRENLLAGISAVTTVNGEPDYRSAVVSGFNCRKFVPGINPRRVDRSTQFAAAATKQALDDAGLGLKHGARIGLVVATCRGAIHSYERYLESVKGECWERASAMYFPNLVMSSVGGNITAALGIKGVASTVVGSTGVGLQALINGIYLLQSNSDMDAVVVVAADELTPFLVRMRQAQNPAAADTIFSEGAVALVLERRPDLATRGGGSYASLAGYGMGHDASALANHGKNNGQTRSRIVGKALARAAVEGASVDLRYSLGAPDVFRSEDGKQGSAESLSLFDSMGMPEAAADLFAVAAASLSLRYQETYPVAGQQVADTDGEAGRSIREVLVDGASELGTHAAAVLRAEREVQ